MDGALDGKGTQMMRYKAREAFPDYEKIAPVKFDLGYWGTKQELRARSMEGMQVKVRVVREGWEVYRACSLSLKDVPAVAQVPGRSTACCWLSFLCRMRRYVLRCDRVFNSSTRLQQMESRW